MCYTKQDSLNSYIINFISSLLLYKSTNNTDLQIISIFLFFIGQMQLLDFLFWKNKECNKNNIHITRLAIIFNNLQPIVLFLLFKLFNYEHNKLSIIIIILYTILVTKYTIDIYPKDNCTINDNVCCSIPINVDKDTQVIDWQWERQPNNDIVYFLYILYFVIASFNFKYNKIIFMIITLGSLFISLKIPKLNLSSGRVWCYVASFLPYILLTFNNYFGSVIWN
jgi:hypothetical protein